MRTTVEFPPELMRAAKARSAESGESLKALLTRAVVAELGAPAIRRGKAARVSLPLFGHDAGAPVRVTSADIEQALADSDAPLAAPRRAHPRARRRAERR